MADQTVHDVVEQPQSVDALRSTDVPAAISTDFAARAVADATAFNASDTSSTTLPQSIKLDDTVERSSTTFELDDSIDQTALRVSRSKSVVDSEIV